MIVLIQNFVTRLESCFFAALYLAELAESSDALIRSDA